MAINNYTGQTFVAFLDISGFKELMRKDKDALEALRRLYQAGFDVLADQNGVEGIFVSDSGILFVRDGSSTEKLNSILTAIKSINQKMLRHGYMLTTSIAFGEFDYHGKLEFDGILKNPIYGFAYVQAFLDNEKGQPKIQPGQCRIIKRNFPNEIDLSHRDFEFVKERGHDNKHFYFYWNVQHSNEIEDFEQLYTDSYKLKYEGMLQALKQHNNNN
jgi:hypothetical protein